MLKSVFPKGNTLIFLFAFVFCFTSCDTGESETSGGNGKTEENTGPVPGKTEAAVEEQIAPKTTPSFLICRGENVRLRKTPDLKGEVVTQLSRETVLEHNGVSEVEAEEVVLNGHTFKSSWMKVKVIGSEIEGWVYGAMDRDAGIVDWLQRDSQIDNQSKEGRSLRIWANEPRAAIERAFELEGLNYEEAVTFSGYSYTHLVNDEKVPNGPFFLASSIGNDRNARMLLEGEYVGGKFSRLMLTCTTPPGKFTITFRMENGVCAGREYLEYKGMKRTMQYSDLNCSLDASNLEYDL